MSWFTDIAGRAEDLLNQIDKNAADVLHDLDAKIPGHSPTRAKSGTQGEAEADRGPLYDNRPPEAAPISSSFPQSKRSSPTKRKKDSIGNSAAGDEEKLIEVGRRRFLIGIFILPIAC